MANLTTVLPQVNRASTSSIDANKSKGAPAKDAPEATDLKAFETELKAGIEKTDKKTAKKDSKGEAQDASLAAAQNQAQLLQQALKPEAKNVSEKDADPKKGGNLKLAPDQGATEKGTKNPLKTVQLTQAQEAMLARTQSPTLGQTQAAQGQKVQAQTAQAQKIGQKSNTIQAGTEKAQLAHAAAMANAVDEADQDFEVESLDLKTGAAASALMASQKSEHAAQTAKAPLSKLSTSDYLNLRDVSKKDPIGMSAKTAPSLELGTFGKADPKKARVAGNEKDFAGAALSSSFQLNSHAKVVDAPTTQNGVGKTILSHDAIHQLTQQVNLMSQAKQDGEIKIRLRPDHLGELQMSVRTEGQNVAIQIKAHDGEAKKIIEESLGSLRASLSDQNLTLSRVDVVTQASQAQAGDQGLQMDSGQRQNSGQDNAGRFMDQQQNARQERLYEETSSPRNLDIARANRMSRSGADGLDMIA